MQQERKVEGPGKSGSLEEALFLIGTGDKVAFHDFYMALRPRVYGLVRRILVDESQAEEVTQEVFLEVWRTAVRFERARGAAASWVLTMARRRAIDRVRASQSSRDRDHREGARLLEREYDSVADHAEIRDCNQRVRKGMDELTALQRQAVELAYVQDLSYSEISTLLQVPVGTIKTRVRDGLARLRTNLVVSDMTW